MPTSFPHLGLHLDLRIQVMPAPALKQMATEAASAGLNTLLVEWEATYPFKKHAVLSNRYAYTRTEIADFLAHCEQLGLDVIPLQQCFGHVEYLLRHERYAHLRESETDLCQLCPCKADQALPLFEELLADLASSHHSPHIHIGGDETYLLGHCPTCRAKAEKDGKSRLYVDYFKLIAQAVLKLGKRPLLWADMLLKYPEAAAEMPRECIFVDWNYGWPVDRFGPLSNLLQSRFEIWGSPALRSAPDNHSLTCWRTHFGNLRDFIPHARRHRYTGMILTSWSTSGIYGHNWDHPGELLDLVPMRRVYPLAGFRILLRAFAAASAQSTADFDPRDFVIAYGRTRFGLSPSSAALLWTALTLDEKPAAPGSVLPALLRHARRAKRLLHALKPTHGLREFSHFTLMADLREFHLRFKVLEAKIQSPWLTSTRLPTACLALERLLPEARTLDQRFRQINRAWLHPHELDTETDYRFEKLRQLHARLARTGRKPALR